MALFRIALADAKDQNAGVMSPRRRLKWTLGNLFHRGILDTSLLTLRKKTMSRGVIVSSLSALAISLCGSVFAAEGPGIPKAPPDGPGAPASVPEEPIGDPEKQAKTEEMLKGMEKGLTGDVGGETSSQVTQPTPDPEKQAETEKNMKERREAVQPDPQGQ